MTLVDISTIHHAVYWQCTPKSIILNLRISTLRVSLGGLESLFYEAPSSISTPLRSIHSADAPLKDFKMKPYTDYIKVDIPGCFS